MTVSTAPTPLSYSGNGATTAFPITWKYNAKSHIVATLRSSTGTETIQVLTTNYTLTDPGDTGTLTMLVAPASGETLVITLEPPNTQSSDIPLGGDFPSTTVEDGLDLSAQRDQKIQSQFDRSLRVPKTDSRTGSNLEIPIDTDRASKFLAFDSDGDPIAAAGTSADLGPVTAFINTLLDDTTAAAARTTLSVRSISESAASGAVGSSTLTMNTSRLLGRTTASSGAIEEISVGTDMSLSGGSLGVSAATTSLAGKVELATTAETQTGTDTTRAVTPEGLAGKFVLNAKVAVATGSTVNLSTTVPSWVKRITLLFNAVSTNGTAETLIQLSTGASFSATGYVSSGSIAAGTTTGNATATTGFQVGSQIGASDARYGIMTLQLYESSTNTWVATSIMASGTSATSFTGGVKAMSGVVDGVRITTSDTFDGSGNISITYE